MPKVAHASLIYFRLSENWIHTQLKYLRDFESVVFTNKKDNLDSVDWKPFVYSREDQLPFLLRALDSLVMWMIGYYLSFYVQAKKKKIALIHAHFGPMGYLCSGLAQRLKIPLVTTFYGYDASQLPIQNPKWRKKYKLLFERGSRFLVEGPAMKEKLEDLGCPSEKIMIHHLGIELEKYEARKEYTKRKKLRLLMVGRFVEKKGFMYGLNAFNKFKEDGGEGTLTIVGDSSGTAESDRVKQNMVRFVEEHNLEDAVTFAGMIPLEELQQEYYNHDVFLAPSVEAENGDNEGGAPVTIIEASATGMPVIGSRHCDIPEVVQDNKTGLLADERDIDELANHLIKMYNNPGLREKLGREGANYIRNNFNAEKQGRDLSRIYQECLES